jgi:two-component system CheB/CheR fusion protein
MAGETKSGPDTGQLKGPKPSTTGEAADAVDFEAGEERAGEREQNQKAQGRFVVGVGASAGGLEALEELLNEISEINAAVVVVQHLSPHYASALTQLLARNSKIGIATATDGTVLEANQIYVIPPNADLSVFHGILYLTTPVGGPHFPIDHFFRSLADDQGAYAIGIVLSGTGTDGTFGLTAIKAAGGITYVQEPSSAKYDGMPRSALASGASDFCLTPKAIGAELGRITTHRREKHSVPSLEQPRRGQDESGKLFMLIRAQFGNDLTQYKPATLDRRIERRMTMHKIGRLEEYVKFAQSHPDELRALYKDMLITVTSFFRDPEAFEALKTEVFPSMLNRRESGEPIRIWVPACSSGEEAYSIAICLFEFLEDKAPGTDIQIFGTDIDEDSIQIARRGSYAQNISIDVSTERLNRFFIRKDGDYQISRRIRDAVVFSRQNILKDAPFSRTDLVSCRNLLIYLRPVAQKKVLRVIHYSLKPSGFLQLGSSETAGDDPELFLLVDRKTKIYTKKAVAVSYTGFDVNFGGPVVHEIRHHPPATRPTVNLQGLADRQVLELYGPPGVVINHLLDILQFRGHTGAFLDPAPGSASFNILRLVRPAFQIDLKRIIEEAISKQTRVSCEATYHDEGKQSVVKLDVIPLQDPETQARCFLVLFNKLPTPKEIPVLSKGAQENEVLRPLTQRVQELEGELAITRDYLSRTNQEKESANEQLQAANEELQSSNEELQSINEELETSKEEMQSTNEELTTVNDELHNRMEELSLTNDDLHNVLSGIDLAIIIVGLDLRVRRYTAVAEKLFHMVPADIGRPIDIIDPFIEPSKLRVKAQTVIETLSTLEEDVLASNQRWYALRISPYQTLDRSIRGALVALSDIDIRKRTTELTTDVTAYPARFLAAITHPLMIVDNDTRVLWANDAFLAVFHTVEEPAGRLLTTLDKKQFANPGLQDLLRRALSIGTGFRDYRMTFHTDEEEDILLRIGGSRIPSSSDKALVLLSIEIDVVQKVHHEP